jgi:predicted nucleic acid-binding protein
VAAVTTTATWLVDTSALIRFGVSDVGATLRSRIDGGQVAVAAVTWLEIGYAAESLTDHEADQLPVLGRLQLVYGTPRSERRAIEVQRMLMADSQHRGVKIPDLLVAAIAETEGLIVLHYDADFDRIAAVTDQPSEWVVPRGSTS